jgi:hypothetical protein
MILNKYLGSTNQIQNKLGIWKRLKSIKEASRKVSASKMEIVALEI